MESVASSVMPPTPEVQRLRVLNASASGMAADEVVSELLTTLKEAKAQIEPLGTHGRNFADCAGALDELNAFVSQNRSTFDVLARMANSVNGSKTWTSTVDEIVRMQQAISNADYELRRMMADKSKHSSNADRAIGDLHRAGESFRTAIQNLQRGSKRGNLFPSII